MTQAQKDELIRDFIIKSDPMSLRKLVEDEVIKFHNGNYKELKTPKLQAIGLQKTTIKPLEVLGKKTDL
jgi:hypothetical protein